MAFFPLFVDIENKHVLVVGGGVISERRIQSLLEFGCRISVVSPVLTDRLRELTEQERIVWFHDVYRTEYLTQPEPWLFVLAAAYADVNAEVVVDCRKNKIPVNNASNKEACDFYFPGLVKEDQMVIGITSGGRDHKAVAALTKKIRELVRKTWQA